MEHYALSNNDIQWVEHSIRQHLVGGAVLSMLLIFGIGGWAMLASLQSAVIAPGTVVVQSNKQTVQHQDGGIVDAIQVKEGDYVKANAVLIRLDGTQLSTELDAVLTRIAELDVRRWRLTAERDGLDELPPLVIGKPESDTAQSTNIAVLKAVQIKRFVKRHEVLVGRKKQLQERAVQLGQEVDGLDHIIKSKRQQLALIDDDLDGLRKLRRRELVPVSRLNAKIRDRLTITGELGRLKTDIAQTRGKIIETNLQIIEQTDSFEADALKELEATEGELAQLGEKRKGLEDKLNRLEIRAPSSGRVHEVAVHTVGGVIRAGDLLLSVIPDSDKLVINARIPPYQRDRVNSNMGARVRFTAFNSRNTPELLARVSWVSPDQTVISENQEPFYKIRIVLAPGEIERLDGKKIEPGMPAEVMITSEERTVISYLLKPLSDQINRAFRER